jgi:L-alanine-DL-glutamate epimerase-like enolase superfamily enzyme
MKIARVEALHADGGWRPWTFVRIETDTGLVGWGECSDNRSPHGIAGSVRDLVHLLIGQDPRPVERLYWDMLRASRQNYGGVSFKATACGSTGRTAAPRGRAWARCSARRR